MSAQAMQRTGPVLQASGLQKRFGSVVAASDMSLGVADGERVSLIGSNGAGKTTFVNMITGYIKPAIDRASALLERFGLAAHMARPVSELPGGVRKLLDIAMALTEQPRLLLLDEPTSGVSVEEKFPMMDTVMQALQQEAMTVLFVEHDMDIVERYASRVVAFYSGRIIADAAPQDALRNDEVRRYVTGTLR
jgi:ABC-type branched-subunit amino acid transport system ATPase component